MDKLFFWMSLVSAISSLAGVTLSTIIERFKQNKVIKIVTITSLLIFVISFIATFQPWKKIHFGEAKVVHDTIRVESKIDQPKADLNTNKSHSSNGFHYRKTKKRIPSGANDYSVSIQGNNSHVVAGSGNNVGINGDVFINQDKLLTPYGLKKITKSVDSLVAAHNLQKNLAISTYSYFNVPLIMEQIQKHFELKGFNVNTSGTVMSNGPMVLGYKVSYTIDGSWVGIELGYFK